jgi:hypothetical protein
MAPTDQVHPVVRAVEAAREALAGVVDLPVWSLGAGELRGLVADLARLSSMVTAVEAGVLAQAERCEVGADVGATSTANWLALETRLTRTEAHRRMRLARDLDLREASAAALAAGAVVPEQVRVILDAVAAVQRIPEDSLRGRNRAELTAAAEARLLVEAAAHDAQGLRVLGRHLLDVIAPEVAEEHERRLLEDEERRAREQTRLTISEDGHGLVHGRFTMPALAGSMLRKALLGLMAPKHRAATGHGRPGPVQGRPSPEKMGAAFCEYVERYPVDRLPHAGGVAASVVVTVGLDRLREALGAAAIDDGGRISATEARRLACEAGIVPAVLAGTGQPLDVGRKHRFHTEPQRIAIGIRDGCCTAEGCDWPPGLCHVHHEIPWSHGGRTSVTDGRLLCPKHHSMAHDPHTQTTRLGTGKLRFTRRT